MGPYKLYKSIVVKAMLKVKTPYPFIPALIFYTTRDVVTVGVRHGKRKFGRSDYSFAKRLQTFSNLLINNSTFLLRIIAIVGVSISIISFLLSAFFIVRDIVFATPVPGWIFLTAVTSVANGLVLFAIGIGSEYVIRMMNGIENRPAYIIRSVHQKRKQQ
jgi:dolichol-phosphate mannosyltransferase/undecaprenyl-phosphate 4-deoxy-4-formamido-L-arabinose transferase